MVEMIDPKLKFRFIWLLVGYSLVSLVIYLSLTSRPVDVDIGVPFSDKLFHALAYFSLMIWFSQIYHVKLKRNVIALVFIVMGILLEYLQSFDPARSSEVADMVANTTGVALGFYLALSQAKNCLVIFEDWIN